MSEPIPLSLYMTEDKRPVAGMPGNVFRSASACHCSIPNQIFRGNTRVIHDFQNLDLVTDAFVELTFVGCFHFASRCPPHADLTRVRSQAHIFDNPLILGSGAYEEGTYDSGIYEPDYECGPSPAPPPRYENELPLYEAGPPESFDGLSGRPAQGEWERI